MRPSADPQSADRSPRTVPVQLPITLGQFLKVAGLVGTGGEAKYLIASGEVTVEGVTETRRGRHLGDGDEVRVRGETVTVAQEPSTGGPAAH